MYNFWQRLRILAVLLRRDLMVMGANVRASLIDCAVQGSALVLLQGYLFPFMGMPTTYSGALCIGSLVLFLLTQNSNMSFRLQSDIAYSGFIRYQLILPLPKSWFLARYVIRFALQSMFVNLPTLMLVFVLLWNQIPNLAIRPLAFCVVYPLALLTVSSLLAAIGFLYDFAWLRANMWRRRLDPLLFTSTVFFAWQGAYAFSPRLATLLLCNPLTHVVEALRNSLLHFEIAPSLWFSIVVMIITIIVNFYLMHIGLTRRLDPV